jgi:uncharacterized protein
VPITIAVIGDTHATSFDKVPEEMREAIQEADRVIHVGDYGSKDVLDSLVRLKGSRFRGVYGNTDSQAIRDEVPAKDILEIEGKRIGITHPAAGGPSEGTERRVMALFKDDNVDVVVYGHTHDPRIAHLGGVWLVSPGKGYLEQSYFGSPTTFVVLTIGEDIRAEIRKISR